MAGTMLVRPSRAELAGYVEALERGWSPDNVRKDVATREHLARIGADPDGFLAAMDDPDARGPPVRLLDGTQVPRLPGFTRWIWAGSFCGAINLRWPADGGALPPHVLGHVGYAVVPWRRRERHATRALGLLLGDARAVGLAHVEVTTDVGNLASARVILANGGRLVERFARPASVGGGEDVRYRIDLAS